MASGSAYKQKYLLQIKDVAPKGEHSYLLRNLLGRVSVFAETYRIDDLQTEASMQNLNIAGCTYSLAIRALERCLGQGLHLTWH